MFWEEYLTMEHILLNYVRSERDGIWDLHLLKCFLTFFFLLTELIIPDEFHFTLLIWDFSHKQLL